MTTTPAPSTPTERDVLRNAVAAAVLAPSSHNSQPWRFRIFRNALDVLTDRGRHLHVIDAERRQQIQSCGCALFNARIAVRAMGWFDDVRVADPRSGDPDHLATLEIAVPHDPTPADQAMLAAIPARRTNRRAFLPRPIAAAETDVMIALAARLGVTATRLTPPTKQALGHLIERADEQQFADPAFRAELATWLRPFGSRQRDGIPFVEKEYGSALPFTVMRALRSPTIGERFGHIEDELVLGAPAVLVLGTPADDAAAWLACGQALQAVLLHTTALGMSASFLNQVLELPALRGEVAGLVPEVGFPHMILRLGYPAEPIHRAAPRRDVADVLEELDDPGAPA